MTKPSKYPPLLQAAILSALQHGPASKYDLRRTVMEVLGVPMHVVHIDLVLQHLRAIGAVESTKVRGSSGQLENRWQLFPKVRRSA